MRKIRVLYIGHSYILARNRFVPAKLADDPELEITVAAPAHFQGDYGPLALEPSADGRFQLVGLPVHWKTFVQGMWYSPAALRALIEPGRFDFIDAWVEPYTAAGYQIARAANTARIPFAFRTAQSLVKRYPFPFSYFQSYVVRSCRLWTHQAQLVKQARIASGYPEQKSYYQPFGVDLSIFRPLLAEERAAVLAELGLKPPVVCYLGRFVEAKGLDVLMDAFSQIGPSRPWSLLLLGDGPYHAKIAEWAAGLGCAGRVQMKLVKHLDVPRYLGAADLLVAPSQTRRNWKEQFGRMLIEAFACGVPVIGSDSGEIPFVIADCGGIVKEDDSSAWAAEIMRFLDDAALRKRCIDKGLEKVKQHSSEAEARSAKAKILRALDISLQQPGEA